MKTDSYIWSYNDVEKAYLTCIKNKRNSCGAKLFNENRIDNLLGLCEALNNGTYEIGKSVTFIVTKPVHREVFAAAFSDRIVHHLLINETLQYFEEVFHPNAYACRKDKGVIYGVQSVFEQLKTASNNYTKDVYVFKLDLKSFFMSINKQILANMVENFIEAKYPNNKKKPHIQALFKQVILNQPELNCLRVGDLELWDELEYGKSLFDTDGNNGLPIGNLTSQILANFYLNPLDYFITEKLGFKYYGRYVDDFVIIDEDKEKLLQAIKSIEDFCKETLKIKLHPKKRHIVHYSKGFRFIGSVIKKNRIYTIDRTKGYIKNIINENKVPDLNKSFKLFKSINSYFGFLTHTCSFKFR